MIRNPLFWACAVALGLASVLYYPVFVPPTDYGLGIQGEEFFFEANEAAGVPVLVLAFWLFYRRSHTLDLLRGPGAPRVASIALALSTALFGWGVHTQAADLQLLSSLGFLAGAVLWFGGGAALRAFWLPILFLGFALPLSPVVLSAVMFPIQLATASYAGGLLNLFGFDTVVRGDQILRADHVFVVIETCSGVRTIVTLTMLTVLMIDLFGRRGGHAVVLLGLAPLVAFGVNGLRVVTLVLNPHSSIHSIHNLQGIAMLLVGLTLMYLIDGMLARAFGAGDEFGDERDYGLTNTYASSLRSTWVGVGLITLLLAGMLVSARTIPIWTPVRDLDESPDQLLERVFGPDSAPPFGVDYNFIGSVRYSAQSHRHVDGGSVEVLLGVADEQDRRYSVLTKRLAWPASGYAPVSETFVEIEPGGPIARRMLLARGARSVLSYSWVERRGSWLAEWFRQAAALDRSPFVRSEHMLAIRLSTRVAPDGSRSAMDEAESRIRRVWKRLAPELDGYAVVASGRSAESADHDAANPLPRHER
jgi:exosortase